VYLLYSLLLTIGLIILLPRFLLDAIRHGKYVVGLHERLGYLPTTTNRSPAIWIHCVSVGETQAAAPLIERLSKEMPSYRIVISTTTITGQQLAKKLFSPYADIIFYFPIDLGFCVRRALKTINPSSVLIMETELWPRFLKECSRAKIPVCLVNGRISEKSFGRYKLIRPFFTKTINLLKLACMQNEDDMERLIKLGFDRTRATVTGNVKFDLEESQSDLDLSRQLLQELTLDNQLVIIAASTHAPEEQAVVSAFQKILIERRDIKLIVAPRHPERFNEVAEILRSSGLRWGRRSRPETVDAETEAILLDSIGELRGAYRLADLAFVGGSIAPTGGHNILEPAMAGCVIVVGPFTHNFREIITTFKEARALIEIPESADYALALENTFRTLLSDQVSQIELRERAKQLIVENKGATDRTMTAIRNIVRLTQ
jgi:3-deoxy-D-manno-octulosonic-acid transferase